RGEIDAESRRSPITSLYGCGLTYIQAIPRVIKHGRRGGDAVGRFQRSQGSRTPHGEGVGMMASRRSFCGTERGTIVHRCTVVDDNGGDGCKLSASARSTARNTG
ncbi:unnamed protein product, partial [Ectocarpus sp. 8 AP-2014]